MNAYAIALRVLGPIVLLSLAGSVFAQQDYPNRPIRYIVPYAPGGSTTWTSRLVGQRLTEVWGQQVETALRLYDQHRRGWSIRRGGAARWQRGRHLPPTREWVRAHPRGHLVVGRRRAEPPSLRRCPRGLGASSSPSAGENRARSRTPASGAGLGVPRQEKGP